jgi:glutaredoxin
MIARGKIVEDPFWFEKGSMKAIRNATARLIDEELKSNIIALAKQQKKVKVISENELHQVEAAKEKAKPKAYEENPELAKFWMSFKSIFDYEKYKAELNGLLHKLLTLHFKKQSLREKGIDYGKFLMILLEDTEMQKYLKAKTEVEQAPIFEGDEI